MLYFLVNLNDRAVVIDFVVNLAVFEVVLVIITLRLILSINTVKQGFDLPFVLHDCIKFIMSKFLAPLILLVNLYLLVYFSDYYVFINVRGFLPYFLHNRYLANIMSFAGLLFCHVPLYSNACFIFSFFSVIILLLFRC